MKNLLGARDEIQSPRTLMDTQREDGGQRMVIEDILTMQVQVLIHNYHITNKNKNIKKYVSKY